MLLCDSYFQAVDKYGELVIQLSGLTLCLNRADVHLLEVAHDHHLPLPLVFGHASVGRASEALLVNVVTIFLKLWLDHWVPIARSAF